MDGACRSIASSGNGVATQPASSAVGAVLQTDEEVEWGPNEWTSMKHENNAVSYMDGCVGGRTELFIYVKACGKHSWTNSSSIKMNFKSQSHRITLWELLRRLEKCVYGRSFLHQTFCPSLSLDWRTSTVPL